MFSKLNNKKVVKKKQNIELTYLNVLELVKQLKLGIKLGIKLTKEQENKIILEIQSIFTKSSD